MFQPFIFQGVDFFPEMRVSLETASVASSQMPLLQIHWDCIMPLAIQNLSTMLVGKFVYFLMGI